MRTSPTFPTAPRKPYQRKIFVQCELCEHEDSFDETIDAHLSEIFISRRTKMLIRLDSFMLYEKLVLIFLHFGKAVFENES